MPPGGLEIGGEQIGRVEGARFLGVWVDEGLSWAGQIDKVGKKVGRLLGVLGRLGSVLGCGSSSHSVMGWSYHTFNIA